MTITITNAVLKALQARAEAAQEHYEAQERALRRADGQPVYGEAETRDRLGALRAERTAAMRQIQEEAGAVRAAARAEIERVENADPLAALSAEELAVANARRPFALDAADGLDRGDLLARLRSVLAGGDRGEIGAYLAAGSHARGRFLERRRDAAERNAGTPAARASVTTYTPFDGVLGEMRAALVGAGEVEGIEAAREREQEAMGVELLAGNLKDGARTSAAAWANRSVGTPGRVA